MGGGEEARSVKYFERSNGLDTALYNNIPFFPALEQVQQTDACGAVASRRPIVSVDGCPAQLRRCRPCRGHRTGHQPRQPAPKHHRTERTAGSGPTVERHIA